MVLLESSHPNRVSWSIFLERAAAEQVGGPHPKLYDYLAVARTIASPSARKVYSSPFRQLCRPGGLMEMSNASLQRGVMADVRSRKSPPQSTPKTSQACDFYLSNQRRKACLYGLSFRGFCPYNSLLPLVGYLLLGIAISN